MTCFVQRQKASRPHEVKLPLQNPLQRDYQQVPLAVEREPERFRQNALDRFALTHRTQPAHHFRNWLQQNHHQPVRQNNSGRRPGCFQHLLAQADPVALVRAIGFDHLRNLQPNHCPRHLVHSRQLPAIGSLRAQNPKQAELRIRFLIRIGIAALVSVPRQARKDRLRRHRLTRQIPLHQHQRPPRLSLSVVAQSIQCADRYRLHPSFRRSFQPLPLLPFGNHLGIHPSRHFRRAVNLRALVPLLPLEKQRRLTDCRSLTDRRSLRHRNHQTPDRRPRSQTQPHCLTNLHLSNLRQHPLSKRCGKESASFEVQPKRFERCLGSP